MTWFKELRQVSVIFAVALVVTVVAVISTEYAMAASRRSPEAGHYILRYHHSGHVTATRLALYTEPGAAAPANASFTVREVDGGCNPSSTDKTVKLDITAGGRGLLSRALHNCKSSPSAYRTYDLRASDWSYDSNNGRRYVNITLQLSKTSSHSQSYYTGDRRARFEFLITSSPSNIVVANLANAYSNSNSYAQRYGVAGAYNRDSSTLQSNYVMEFAMPPCSTSSSEANMKAGMWDPDNYGTFMKLQRRDRGTNNAWLDMTPGSGNRYNIASGPNAAGYYTPRNVSDDSAYFNFTAYRSQEYRLVVVTEADNVVSLFWPYASIYADDDGCWDVTPTTTLTATGTSVGSVITWTHRVRNATGNAGLTAAEGLTVRALNQQGLGSGVASPSPWNSVTVGANGGSYTRTTTHTVRAADVGRTLCRATSVTPGSSKTRATDTSSRACITIPGPSDQQLTPSIEIDREYVNQGGAVLTSPKIDNSSASAASGREWRIIRYPGPANREGGDNAQAPCAYFGGGSNCVEVRGNNNQTVPADGMDADDFGNANQRSSVIPVDAPIGSQFCFALSVSPYRPGLSWYHSEPRCVTVVKNPKVQVLGGDVRTRQFIRTSTESARFNQNIEDSETLFGSWSQYGALSGEQSTGLVSASKVKNGSATTDINNLLLHPLTFGNNPITDRGHYTLPTLPDDITFSGSGCGANAANLTPGRYSCDDVSISNSNVSGTVIVNSTGTVTISNNIEYRPGGVNDLRDLPQVVIIARDIVINANVTQVDAWLISPSGTLKTCNVDEDTQLVESDCDRLLTVNGPVIADQVALLRTAGSDGSKASNGSDPDERLSSPAEVFNLRPDVYLWASTQGAPRTYRTTSVVELPPRF